MEDAINFRFFPQDSSVNYQPEAAGGPFLNVHRIRNSRIYLQTDFCV